MLTLLCYLPLYMRISGLIHLMYQRGAKPTSPPECHQQSGAFMRSVRQYVSVSVALSARKPIAVDREFTILHKLSYIDPRSGSDLWS